MKWHFGKINHDWKSHQRARIPIQKRKSRICPSVLKVINRSAAPGLQPHTFSCLFYEVSSTSCLYVAYILTYSESIVYTYKLNCSNKQLLCPFHIFRKITGAFTNVASLASSYAFQTGNRPVLCCRNSAPNGTDVLALHHNDSPENV